MQSASTYNRQAVGRLWTLHDLPEEWPGYALLAAGDADHDAALEAGELDRVDWLSFSEAVDGFQSFAKARLHVGSGYKVDGKLGPLTLRHLRSFYGMISEIPDIIEHVAGLEFHRAAKPLSPPATSAPAGHTAEERRLCSLWNNYGGAIAEQAQAQHLPVEAALAVFSVESGEAYDPKTGLVIIRFEPHIFQRKAGRYVPTIREGQAAEWDNLERAASVDPEAALLSTSWGLPQLMGFNWSVTKHRSVQEMVLAFQDSCEEQVAGFFGFVAANGLGRFIQTADWRGFTQRYNGTGNVDAYSGRLIRALKVVDSLKADGAVFSG